MKRNIFLLCSLAALITACHYEDPGRIDPSNQIYNAWREYYSQFENGINHFGLAYDALYQGDTTLAKDRMSQHNITIHDYTLPLTSASTWEVYGMRKHLNIPTKITFNSDADYTLFTRRRRWVENDTITLDSLSLHFTTTDYINYTISGDGFIYVDDPNFNYRTDSFNLHSGIYLHAHILNAASTIEHLGSLLNPDIDLTTVNAYTDETVIVKLRNGEIIAP